MEPRPPAFILPKPHQLIIPGFVWNMLLVEAAQDIYMAARFLYRVWKANPKGVIAWTQAAIKNGWIRKAHQDEDDDPRAVRDWIEKNVLKYKDGL